MMAYPIAFQSGVKWGLISDNSQDSMDAAWILSAVYDIFVETFGIDTVHAHPVLSVIYLSEGPMTLRPFQLIAISSTGRCFRQHIYQFAHELCHFMIPNEVCKEFRWFEESLCQMMSWFALQRIRDMNDDRTRAVARNLSDIDTYIQDSQNGRLHMDASVSEYIRKNIAHLKENCYNRPFNDAVAYALYPFFLKDPKLWKIVPFLHRLTPDMSLYGALSSLTKTVCTLPDCRNIGTEWINALCQDKTDDLQKIKALESSVAEHNSKIIPLFLNPAAAGSASPIFGDEYDQYELKPDDPLAATFAIKVQGDSMEPYFPDESIAFCNKEPLQDGDVGVFVIDGASVIKQYYYDQDSGVTYFLSLNRQRADADIAIYPSTGQTVTCIGKVITQHLHSLLV